jgi:hypothetical protein
MTNMHMRTRTQEKRQAPSTARPRRQCPASLILIALEEKQLVNFIFSVYYYFKNRKKEKRRSQIKESVRKDDAGGSRKKLIIFDYL